MKNMTTRPNVPSTSKISSSSSSAPSHRQASAQTLAPSAALPDATLSDYVSQMKKLPCSNPPGRLGTSAGDVHPEVWARTLLSLARVRYELKEVLVEGENESKAHLYDGELSVCIPYPDGGTRSCLYKSGTLFSDPSSARAATAFKAVCAGNLLGFLGSALPVSRDKVDDAVRSVLFSIGEKDAFIQKHKKMGVDVTFGEVDAVVQSKRVWGANLTMEYDGRVIHKEAIDVDFESPEKAICMLIRQSYRLQDAYRRIQVAVYGKAPEVVFCEDKKKKKGKKIKIRAL